MTSMIEKVARKMDPMAAKIADLLISKGMGRSDVLGILPMEKARAAIEAMREPTDAMIDSGVAFALNVSISRGYAWSEYVADKHQRMIDAALNEAP